ncbi:MAG: hypothetical protein NTZ46_06365 [Verrucomicrobia bacterium]|nr:hypothetical protein [Verrucomicrobiota bacterium]
MNTVSKRFFLAASTACAFLAALCIGLDLYVGMDGVRERVETAIQRQTGGEVKIGGMHYALWSGFRATGIHMRAAASGEPSSTLLLPSVSARVALRPLFVGRVVVQKLVIRSPSLVWVQNANGGWTFPWAKPESRRGPKVQRAAKGVKPEFKVQTVKLHDGQLQFVDKKGKTRADLHGITLQITPETAGKASGTALIQSITLSNGLVFEAFRTPFAWSESGLTLSPVSARLAEGSIGGAATMGRTPGQPPFTLDLRFEGVELKGILAQLGENQKNRRTTGTLLGNIDLYGAIGSKESLGGVGHMRLRGGRMEQIPLVHLIGNALQMDVKELELRQAQLDLRIGEEKVFVDSLVMEASSLNLSAKGTSALDGKLNLAARLAVNPRLSRQLPGWVDANFQPVPGGDWRDIGFAVTGTLSRPETDLLQVMVGQKLGNQFMNLLQSVTGKHKKKSGDKKQPEPSPTEEENEEPQPAATP